MTQAGLQVRSGGRTVATLFQGELPTGPQRIPWTGSAAARRAQDGAYQLVLRVADPVGNITLTSPVVLDTTPPKLSVVSRRPVRLRGPTGRIWAPGHLRALIECRQMLLHEDTRQLFDLARGRAEILVLGTGLSGHALSVTARYMCWVHRLPPTFRHVAPKSGAMAVNVVTEGVARPRDN